MPLQAEPRFAAIVIATGGAPGFMEPLALAPWSVGTLLEHVVEQTINWPVDAVVVVLGRGAEEVVDRCDLGDALIVIDTDWVDGETSALRVGLDVLARDAVADVALVVPADQPQFDEEVVEQLVLAYREHRPQAVVAKYRYARGWPVLVGAELWQRIMTMADDETLERLLLTHPGWVHEVMFDSPPPRRILTPDDLVEMRPRH